MSQVILADGLGYEGKVTLTLKRDNRVLTHKTYKNNGTAQLFQFLGYCLLDSYEEAKRLLPTKILLLRNLGEDANSTSPTNVVQCTTWQGLAQTPIIKSESDKAQVSVTYSFEIPREAISGKFNQVALYGASKTYNDIDEFSAYYFLTDNVGRFVTEDPAEWSATTVLLIEWELTLSNKYVAQSN
jgi:hypothetical protein